MKVYYVIRKKIKTFLSERIIYSLQYKIRGFNIVVYRGGYCNFFPGSKIIGNSKFKFNVSHYRNCYHKKGNLTLLKGAKLEIKNNGLVEIYSGCKIDVFENARLVIGKNVYINEATRIGVKKYVEIGDNTIIGDEVSIHDFDGHRINGVEGIQPVIIGKHVWIGERVTILKGVTIGDNVIIGANSVVTKNIPDNAVAVGNPAHTIKKDVNWSL